MRLGVQLEQNRVGRILLHRNVLPTVPTGLWPLVLERAANTESSFFESDRESEDEPPLVVDGLYYLLKNLLPSGILDGSFPMKAVPRQRSRKKTKPSSKKRSRKKRSHKMRSCCKN